MVHWRLEKGGFMYLYVRRTTEALGLLLPSSSTMRHSCCCCSCRAIGLHDQIVIQPG